VIPPAAVPSLVSPRRLGAALHAHRAAVDTTASALSRHCDGWWGPDDLLEVERGGFPLDDAAIVSLCHLYGLPGRGLPSPDALEMVIDRSDSVELVDDPATSVRASGELGLVRLAALSRLLGTAQLVSDAGLDVLSMALEMSGDEIRTSLDRFDGPSRDVVDPVVLALVDRVVVPAVGLLVATTPSGSLVLARRAGTGRKGSVEGVAAAGPLRWFTALSSTVG
jgi:hypothetical protein